MGETLHSLENPEGLVPSIPSACVSRVVGGYAAVAQLHGAPLAAVPWLAQEGSPRGGSLNFLKGGFRSLGFRFTLVLSICFVCNP